eukprot:gene37065-48394_t
MPLQPNPAMDVKKQRNVSGFIILSHSIISHKPVVVDSEEPAEEQKAFARLHPSLPETILEMENIALSLTVCNAVDLVNTRLIGSICPFVSVFIGDDLEPCFTSVVARGTTSSSSSTNPRWDVTEKLTLGVQPTETTKMSDFPDIRVEVWDMGRNGVGDFLGQVTFPPTEYLWKTEATYALKPSKKNQKSSAIRFKSKNPIKGEISLKFDLLENNEEDDDSSLVLSPFGAFLPVSSIEIIILYGQTSSRPNTANPNWHGEIIVFDTSSSRFLLTDLFIEVRSKTTAGVEATTFKILDNPPEPWTEDVKPMAIVRDLKSEEKRLQAEQLDLPMLLDVVKRQT